MNILSYFLKHIDIFIDLILYFFLIISHNTLFKGELIKLLFDLYLFVVPKFF